MLRISYFQPPTQAVLAQYTFPGTQTLYYSANSVRGRCNIHPPNMEHTAREYVMPSPFPVLNFNRRFRARGPISLRLPTASAVWNLSLLPTPLGSSSQRHYVFLPNFVLICQLDGRPIDVSSYILYTSCPLLLVSPLSSPPPI